MQSVVGGGESGHNVSGRSAQHQLDRRVEARREAGRLRLHRRGGDVRQHRLQQGRGHTTVRWTGGRGVTSQRRQVDKSGARIACSVTSSMRQSSFVSMVGGDACTT